MRTDILLPTSREYYLYLLPPPGVDRKATATPTNSSLSPPAPLISPLIVTNLDSCSIHPRMLEIQFPYTDPERSNSKATQFSHAGTCGSPPHTASPAPISTSATTFAQLRSSDLGNISCPSMEADCIPTLWSLNSTSGGTLEPVWCAWVSGEPRGGSAPRSEEWEGPVFSTMFSKNLVFWECLGFLPAGIMELTKGWSTNFPWFTFPIKQETKRTNTNVIWDHPDGYWEKKRGRSSLMNDLLNSQKSRTYRISGKCYLAIRLRLKEVDNRTLTECVHTPALLQHGSTPTESGIYRTLFYGLWVQYCRSIRFRDTYFHARTFAMLSQ